MTATYVNTLLTARDRLRFQLGDTDTADALLADEEIAAAVTIKTTEDAALVYLAKGLLRRYARLPVKITADGASIDWGERVAAWREIIADAETAESTGLRVRRLARPQEIADQGEYTT